VIPASSVGQNGPTERGQKVPGNRPPVDMASVGGEPTPSLEPSIVVEPNEKVTNGGKSRVAPANADSYTQDEDDHDTNERSPADLIGEIEDMFHKLKQKVKSFEKEKSEIRALTSKLADITDKLGGQGDSNKTSTRSHEKEHYIADSVTNTQEQAVEPSRTEDSVPVGAAQDGNQQPVQTSSQQMPPSGPPTGPASFAAPNDGVPDGAMGAALPPPQALQNNQVDQPGVIGAPLPPAIGEGGILPPFDNGGGAAGVGATMMLQ
jgi:hypothetical protein